MPWAIETFELSKQFPIQPGWRDILTNRRLSNPVIDQVNISIRHGERFGLLGPNGAGKTTLIKTLCTLILPTSGGFTICGFDNHHSDAIRHRIGMVSSDERSFFWRLTAGQNLEFFASLHGMDTQQAQNRIQWVLEQVGLGEFSNQRFQTFSTGMRQRLAIARAILHEPQLLFMDEPSKGLDVSARQSLHNLINDFSEKTGITILLTTHDLFEAEKICDRIAIMHHGRILDIGTTSELRQRLDLKDEYVIEVQDISEETKSVLNDRLNRPIFFSRNSNDNDMIRSNHISVIKFSSDHLDHNLNQSIDILRADGVTIQSIERNPVSLEMIYTQLVSHSEKISQAIGRNTHHSPLSTNNQKASKSGFSWQQNLSIAFAFFKRDYRSESSYRISFFLQLLSIILTVGIFYFVASLLGQIPLPQLDTYGGDYFSFVLIGIAFAGYFSTGLNSFAQSMRNAQSTGTMEAMLSTPIRLSTMILSSSLWDYFITTIRVLVYLLVGSFLIKAQFHQANYLGAFITLMLTIIVFSSLGIIAASFIMVLKRGDPITWAFASINSFFGGVYFPVAIFPDWLLWISKLLPTTYALNAMRLSLLQGLSLTALIPDLLALCAFIALLLPMSILAFRYAVRRAKIDGSLTHY